MTEFAGNGKLLVHFGQLLRAADGLGFSKEPLKELAYVTSCTIHPNGIYAKLPKSVLFWK